MAKLSDKITIELTQAEALQFRNNFPEAARNLYQKAAENAQPYLDKRSFVQRFKDAWRNNNTDILPVPRHKVENAQELQKLNELSNNWVDRNSKKKQSMEHGVVRALSKQKAGLSQAGTLFSSNDVARHLSFDSQVALKVLQALPDDGQSFYQEGVFAPIRQEVSEEQFQKTLTSLHESKLIWRDTARGWRAEDIKDDRHVPTIAKTDLGRTYQGQLQAIATELKPEMKRKKGMALS